MCEIYHSGFVCIYNALNIIKKGSSAPEGILYLIVHVVLERDRQHRMIQAALERDDWVKLSFCECLG